MSRHRSVFRLMFSGGMAIVLSWTLVLASFGRGSQQTLGPVGNRLADDYLVPVLAEGARIGDHRASLDGAPLAAAEPDAAARARLDANFGRLPLHFEPNVGQTADGVRFLSRGSGYTLFLTASEAVLSLRQPVPMETRANLGDDPNKWHANIPTYAKVGYENVYPGIDLFYYGNQNKLEYDFVLAPGSNPGAIRLAFDGARKIQVDSHGDLVLQTAAGEVRLRKPHIYQDVDGTRRTVSGGYVLRQYGTAGIGIPEIGFRVNGYDATRPLVIDPVLEYSTYVGWAGGEAANDIIVDPDGNVYLTGRTDSVADPPITLLGAGGGRDVFVVKIDPTGSILEYVTFFGGAGSDTPGGIALSLPDSVVVVGHTNSTDFPVTATAFSTVNSGATDGFVVRLGSNGSDLSYATYGEAAARMESRMSSPNCH